MRILSGMKPALAECAGCETKSMSRRFMINADYMSILPNPDDYKGSTYILVKNEKLMTDMALSAPTGRDDGPALPTPDRLLLPGAVSGAMESRESAEPDTITLYKHNIFYMSDRRLRTRSIRIWSPDPLVSGANTVYLPIGKPEITFSGLTSEEGAAMKYLKHSAAGMGFELKIYTQPYEMIVMLATASSNGALYQSQGKFNVHKARQVKTQSSDTGLHWIGAGILRDMIIRINTEIDADQAQGR